MIEPLDLLRVDFAAIHIVQLIAKAGVPDHKCADLLVFDEERRVVAGQSGAVPRRANVCILVDGQSNGKLQG